MSPNEIARLAGPTRPLGSVEIPQFHLPTARKTGVFAPRLYGAARVHFADRKRKIDETRRVAYLSALEPGTRTIDWDAAVQTDAMPDHLLQVAPGVHPYLPLPAGAMDLKVFTRWAKNFDRWIARTQRLDLPAASEGAAGSGPAAAPTAPSSESALSIGPKRGGVSVELLAIAWELT